MNLYDIAIAKKLSGGGGGGGGDSRFELLATQSLGHIETTATSSTEVVSIALEAEMFNGYDLILAIASTGNVADGVHYATATTLICAGDHMPTVNSLKWGTVSQYVGTSANDLKCNSGAASSNMYGVFATPGSTGSKYKITFNSRYSASASGTINGDYTAKIYGVKFFDLI